MKKIIIVILSVLLTNLAMSQVLRVAISDFENLSGNPKYDGLGKALSSMLISDIELNVSGKKMQLVERSQLNKILKEQNLQTSKSFDKATTVKVGKLLGINFILVGDIFVLNDDIIINARLTSVENGDIKFSNKQEGKLSQWLSVKTKIAKDLSSNLKVPFIEPSMPDNEVSPGIITKYATAIDEIDKGNLEKAATIAETVKEINPEFTYSDDLKKEIDKIKKEISQLRNEVETSVVDPIESGFLFYNKKDFDQAIKYFNIGLSRIENKKYGSKYAYFIFLSTAYLSKGDPIKAISYSDSVLMMNPYEPKAIIIKSAALFLSGKNKESLENINDFIKNKKNIGDAKILYNSLLNFSKNNKGVIFDGMNFKQRNGFETILNDVIQNDDLKYYINRGSVYEIASGDYTFKQKFDFKEIISYFSEITNSINFNPISYANFLNSIKLDSDTINLFTRLNEKKIESDIVVYTVKDTTKFINAINGKTYKGQYHLIDNNYGSKRGAYSHLKDSLYYRNSYIIECPCDILLLKETYYAIKNNSGTIDINNEEHAIQVTSSAWYYLIGKDYAKSSNMFLSLIKYYIKLGRDSKGTFLNKEEFDSYRMSIINLGHSYMLSGNYPKAISEYQNDLLDKEFGKEWNNMTKTDVFKQDWNEFVSKNLISQKEIDYFNMKYKILNKFE